MSCNSNTPKEDSSENANRTNPSAIDTTQHPTGITNGNVISTDTAAMNTKEVKEKETKNLSGNL